MGHGRGRKKTKPIPLLRISDCGLGIGDGAAREHLPAACYRWPAWAGCTNKPNFGESDLEDKCCADKELQCIGRGENPRKTKPIVRLRTADCGLRIRRGCGLPPRACAGRLCKQTQFQEEF
jgi:hypothetical protein